MVGSHVNFSMDAAIGGWLAPGARMRSIIGNTIVLKDGKPVLSMGTPGNVHCTIPQLLSNCLDFGMAPYDACVVSRMLLLRDDYVLEIESRIPDKVAADLMKMGSGSSRSRPMTITWVRSRWRGATQAPGCSTAAPIPAGPGWRSCP